MLERIGKEGLVLAATHSSLGIRRTVSTARILRENSRHVKNRRLPLGDFTLT